jgi:hypothetical protein
MVIVEQIMPLKIIQKIMIQNIYGRLLREGAVAEKCPVRSLTDTLDVVRHDNVGESIVIQDAVRHI